MGDVEEYFPRGGKKPSVTYFKQSGNFLGAAEKGERKKVKPKKKSEDENGYLSDEIVAEDDQSFKNCGIYLNYKIVKEGQVFLGRVQKVLDTKILISLPCRLLGFVMACHVSESYNKLLEAYVNDQTDKVCELHEMFRPGQYVAVRVLESNNNILMLSMMPHHVNAGWLHSDLHKGALLQVAVSSVEDHGYVMDVGISNIRAFLPKATVNPEIQLDTGVLTWCCVKSIVVESNNSVLTLSNELEAVQKAVQRRPTTALLPGTALEFTVYKSLDNGIEGNVFNDTTAYVQRQQVDKVKGKRPNLGQKIRARVLYVIPTKKTPFLTMKDIFSTTYPDLQAEQKFQEGEIIEDAQVIKILGRSILFKLGRDSIGMMSLRRIQIDENLADEDVVAKSYPVGSTHTVRVLCYNLSDYTYSLSDEPSVLSEKIFSISDLAVGDIVPAIVKTVAENRVMLTIGRLNGLVPLIHISDSGVYVDPKKASTSQMTKKYKVGQHVKARVVSLNTEKPLLMTLKPSLLSPDLEILQSYEQAVVGKMYTGVIQCIRDYLLVGFFNNVLCYVGGAQAAQPPPPNLATHFHLGQIVNCTILRVDVQNKKMGGTLLAVTSEQLKKEGKASKRHLVNESSVPEKKRKGAKSETEPTILNNVDKKKKKNGIQEVSEQDDDRKKRKNKGKINELETNENNSENELFGRDNSIKEDGQTNENMETDGKRKKKKKSKEEIAKTNKLNSEENDTGNGKIGETDSHIDNQSSEIKKKKRKSHESLSEENKTVENGAIEMDLYESSDNVLKAQDKGLADLSDCTTPKMYKKRIISIMNSIQAKNRRLMRIEGKINSIEEKGLTATNKKFHTAMHMEKQTVQMAMLRMIEVLKVAQEKFKEFGLTEVRDTIIKKENKEKAVTITKKTDIKEKKPKVVENSKSDKVMKFETVIEAPSAKDFWSAPASAQQDVQQQESSSSEEEEEEKPKKKRKKLTAAEKVAKAREEEEKIRRIERQAEEAAAAPRSADHFERALLASPNSSQLWIAYMAFHLQATEIERARAVGRRALKTISFREEQEKLNVWLAMINFEHRFGTKESQQSTLEEALQMNDKYQVHSKLLDIYLEMGKTQELNALVDLMLRKYRRQPEVYEACGRACYSAGLLDKARQVMQKGIQALDKKEHVSLLVAFAQLERARGSCERAEALFEQVLAVYPQRVDVCSVYVDALIKAGDVDRVRQVMERMTSQKLPARKMKILYKKWIEVEERIGDREQVERISQLAKDYINKAKF